LIVFGDDGVALIGDEDEEEEEEEWLEGVWCWCKLLLLAT
jgi:hypothetical protein